MEAYNVTLAALGLLVLGFGLSSSWLERHPVPMPLLAIAFGVALGPYGFDWIDLARLGEPYPILEKSTRLVLAVGLFSVALRVPKTFIPEHWRSLVPLLALGVPLMWLVCGLVVYVSLGCEPLTAMLIGAIVAATDPIAAAPIVVGPLAERYLPPRLRRLISYESGANDGLGYLFVFLPLLALEHGGEVPWRRWLLDTLLLDVALATAAGLALGWVAARVLQWAERHDAITGDWRLVYTVALSLLAAGAGRLAGGDELLIVFASGVGFVAVVGAEDRREEEHGQEAVNRFFAYPVFALIGLALPLAHWWQLGWSGVAVALGVVLLRRPAAVLAVAPLVPDLRHWRDVLFVGWFGPVAVAATYYAALAGHRLHDDRIWAVTSLVIVCSACLHGLSSVPLTRRYGRAAGIPSGGGGEGDEGGGNEGEGNEGEAQAAGLTGRE